jgi:hypothetical protein
MKAYIHARLNKDDQALLDTLKRSTGYSESELVRQGLMLVMREVGRRRSALEVAGRSVDKFKKGRVDLSTNPKHLEGFGQ